MTGHTFDSDWFQGDDVMRFSLTALREIFRHTPLEELPPEFAACLAGDTQAIQANHDGHRRWKQAETTRTRQESQNTQATGLPATPNPSQGMLLQSTSQQPTPVASRPRSHAPETALPSSPDTARGTVHRTDSGMSRGKRPYSDLALQVCTLHLTHNSGQNQGRWEPCDLFPEIHTPTSLGNNQPETTGVRQSDKIPLSTKPHLPPRTNKGRVNQKENGKDGIIELDVQNFVEVPLQLAEGKELLALIGAGNIPIPSHIMVSSQQHKPNLEVGQPSKTQRRKKKQMGAPTNQSGQVVSPTGGLQPGAGISTQCQEDRRRSSPEPQQGQSVPPRPVNDTDAAGPQNIDTTMDTDGHAEDPYLDQVDYSDEDLPLA